MNDGYRGRVLTIIGRIAGEEPARLTDDMSLVADLGFDSSKALALLCDTEDAFDIEVPEEAVASMDTVGEVVEMVASCLAQEPA